MRALGIVMILAVTGAGCATAPGWHASWHSGWAKAGMTGEAFEADVRDCDAQAMQLAAGQPGHQAQGSTGPRSVNPTAPVQRSAEHEKAYRACMIGKGYTATK